jgi:hypothetical protein
LPIPTAKTTAAPFVTSRLFRYAAALVVGVVVASATVAEQHLTTVSANSAVPVFSPRPDEIRTQPLQTPPVAAAEDVAPPIVAPSLAVPPPAEEPISAQVVYAPPVQLSDESLALLAQLGADVDMARQATRDLERKVEVLDSAIAAAIAARDAAETTAPVQADSAVTEEMRAAIARAQTAYNEAVARERRAAALDAFGVPAAQELEDAQIGVRAAAAELAALRRGAEAAIAIAADEALRAKAQADEAIAGQKTDRDERTAALAQARMRQREAEIALATARERLGASARARVAERLR